jgi:membrane protease YdiL (CAAX protease family)
VAVALAAGLFSLMHVAFAVSQGSGGLVSRAVVTFVMGGVFGVVYQQTDNLVIPAVGHATYWLSPALLVYVS